MTDTPFYEVSPDDMAGVRGLLEAGAALNMAALRTAMVNAVRHEAALDAEESGDALYLVLDHFITNWMTVQLRSTVLQDSGAIVPWSDEYAALMEQSHRGAIATCLSIIKRWPGHPFKTDETMTLHDVQARVLLIFGITQEVPGAE